MKNRFAGFSQQVRQQVRGRRFAVGASHHDDFFRMLPDRVLKKPGIDFKGNQAGKGRGGGTKKRK